jgi:prepilin-type N-terminal cleavage/methylation domain-containing protein
MATQPRVRHDGGFTLIELLVTIMIMGVITLPLGNLVISYFQRTTETQVRVGLSHDEQIASEYFASDVQSAGLRSADLSLQQSIWLSSSGAPACGSGLSIFFVLAWDEYTSSGTRSTSVAVYGTRSQVDNGLTERQLIRQRCSNGSSTADSTAVLAHNLVGTPAVTCADGTCANPTSVTMNLVLRDPADPTGPTFSFDLTGDRRQS